MLAHDRPKGWTKQVGRWLEDGRNPSNARPHRGVLPGREGFIVDKFCCGRRPRVKVRRPQLVWIGGRGGGVLGGRRFLAVGGGQMGRRRVKVKPAPRALWHWMAPHMASARRLTMARPKPVEDSPAVGRALRRVYFWKSFF